MWTPTLVLTAITTLAACVSLGGGLYEFLVIDPCWPKRPGIIQSRNARGSCSRLRRTTGGHRYAMSEDAGRAPQEKAEKDRADWVTGDEPMTGPQRSYLNTLAQEAGEEIPDDLTKAQASELIDRLQNKTGRGQ